MNDVQSTEEAFSTPKRTINNSKHEVFIIFSYFLWSALQTPDPVFPSETDFFLVSYTMFLLQSHFLFLFILIFPILFPSIPQSLPSLCPI